MQAYFKELLIYDPETGDFSWKERKLRRGLERIDKGWNTRFAGKKVASRRHKHGHRQIGLHCKNYMAHRIAWTIFYGYEPTSDLDHINGDAQDNRISNLREASRSQNLMNARIRTDNTSGIKGVSWSKKSRKWYAYITVNEKMTALGLFNDFSEACLARRIAAKELHGEFARAD